MRRTKTQCGIDKSLPFCQAARAAAVLDLATKLGLGFGRSVTSPRMRKFAARRKASGTLPHAPMAMKSAALRGTRRLEKKIQELLDESFTT